MQETLNPLIHQGITGHFMNFFFWVTIFFLIQISQCRKLIKKILPLIVDAMMWTTKILIMRRDRIKILHIYGINKVLIWILPLVTQLSIRIDMSERLLMYGHGSRMDIRNSFLVGLIQQEFANSTPHLIHHQTISSQKTKHYIYLQSQTF
jgi:hypothetical protein